MDEQTPLQVERSAYQAMEAELKKYYLGKFVIFHGVDFSGAFDTFDAAAREAIRLFGRGPYLIRRVADQVVMRMPSSIAFRPASHASY
ncbi:MAG: hypothetical protein H7839_16090 [Magnetococcus sp. YQC-5]